MKIEVYVTESCPFCMNARKWFANNNVPIELTIFKSNAEKNEFYEKRGVRTVPQIYVDDVHIGGYSDLVVSKFAKDVEAGNIKF